MLIVWSKVYVSKFIAKQIKIQQNRFYKSYLILEAAFPEIICNLLYHVCPDT